MYITKTKTFLPSSTAEYLYEAMHYQVKLKNIYRSSYLKFAS